MSYIEESYQNWVKWLRSPSALADVRDPWFFRYDSQDYATLVRMEVKEKGNHVVHITFVVRINLYVHEKTHENIFTTKDKIEYTLKSNCKNRLSRSPFTLSCDICFQ